MPSCTMVPTILWTPLKWPSRPLPALPTRRVAWKPIPCLMEPIMHVTITVPDEYMGDIMGDMNKRRGRIIGMSQADGMQQVEAEAPLAEMFKYADGSALHDAGSRLLRDGVRPVRGRTLPTWPRRSSPPPRRTRTRTNKKRTNICEGGGFSVEKPPPSRSLPKRRAGGWRFWGRGRFSERSPSPPDPLARRAAGVWGARFLLAWFRLRGGCALR